MQFLFTAPVTRPNVDGGATLSGVVSVGPVMIDDTSLKATAQFIAIEDAANGPLGRTHSLTISVTGNETLAQIQAAFKAAIAAALNVTFQ
jgi:hypothetical protein